MIVHNHRPQSFYFKKLYRIERVVEHWREIGEWWRGEQEIIVFIVVADHSFCELHYQPAADNWILYRIDD